MFNHSVRMADSDDDELLERPVIRVTRESVGGDDDDDRELDRQVANAPRSHASADDEGGLLDSIIDFNQDHLLFCKMSAASLTLALGQATA